MTTPFKTTASTKSSNKVYKSQFDVATIVIRVTDVNDHAPEFRPGSCYPLAIPENSELSIIHQVVATDLDEGPNGDITYSITGKQQQFAASFITRIFHNNCFSSFSNVLAPSSPHRFLFFALMLPLTFFRINGFSQYICSIYIFSQHKPNRSDNFS